ncbi:MAG: 6-bladed beta-propeller [Tannerellaceae bacterium]|jgi:hypothetical protein|nr:6-bladed beta-propeller [Tannerellaceae bacterium]
MKKLIVNATAIAIATLLVTAGCTGNKQPSDGLITVDVTASYPEKELILQDFMDVEYVALETTDEFVTQGYPLDVGKDVIMVKNQVNDGDIFIFDRKTGKGLKKINRKGQGGEEYAYVLRLKLDEDNGEMFVNDHYGMKIVVYDMDGNFKRSFKHKEGAMYNHIYNFDRDNLICHDGFFSNDGEANRQSLMIISKQDGSITREIQIPFKEKKIPVLISKDEANGMVYSAGPGERPIIPYFGDWLIVELSADTVYRYSPDHTMTPLIVRTPSIQNMDPEIFLLPAAVTSRYDFMETVKKEFDFAANKGFPETDLVYDKKEKAIYKYVVYNDDYTVKKTVSPKSFPINAEIAALQILQADQLVEAYEKGELKGRLKELAAGLDEESNPVIMLMKHKEL